jgi:hypothetical protein
MMGGYIAKLVAHAILWVVMYLSNKSRDAKLGPADTKLAAAAGMEDKTELVKHNPYVFFSLSSEVPSGSGSHAVSAHELETDASESLQQLPLRPLESDSLRSDLSYPRLFFCRHILFQFPAPRLSACRVIWRLEKMRADCLIANVCPLLPIFLDPMMECSRV